MVNIGVSRDQHEIGLFPSSLFHFFSVDWQKTLHVSVLSQELHDDVLDIVSVSQTFDLAHDRSHELAHGCLA